MATLTYFYFTLPNSIEKFHFSSKFANQPTRFKDYKYLMRMLDSDKISSCGFTREVADLDFRHGVYSIESAKRTLADAERINRLVKINTIKAFPITLDIGKFELDNLDRAELVEGDNGICVENEHGTQFPISDLSDAELDVVIGISYYIMRDRIKSYAQEDDELKLLNFKTMSDADVKYYFEKYLDSGNGQGHL